MNYKAWVVKAAKQPMVLETIDLGPLGAEDVEVAVEHCGVCHSDLSVLNTTKRFPSSRCASPNPDWPPFVIKAGLATCRVFRANSPLWRQK